MLVTEEVFQEYRSRVEISEFLNIEDMFVTEEVFQEDRSSLEILELLNIQDIYMSSSINNIPNMHSMSMEHRMHVRNIWRHVSIEGLKNSRLTVFQIVFHF